jgi:hypothetical protein
MRADTEPAAAAGAGPPFTVDELLDLPLQRGNAAVHLSKPHWYIITRSRNAPAGAIRAPAGGTVDEWCECDPDAEIVEAVPFPRLERSVVSPDSPETVFEAVKHGTVRPVVVPEQRLVRALEEFGEAEQRGEWSGLRDYVTDSSASEVSP